MSEIQLEIFYPYPPELVWDALTDSDALAQWSMDNDFKAVIGAKFTFRDKPNKFWNGIIEGEVIEVERPNRLVYSWRTGNLKEFTTVTWTLDSYKNGTNVRLHHEGFQGIGGFIFSKLILGSGWRKQTREYIPLVLAYIQKHGLKFEKDMWIVPDRAKKHTG